MTQIPRTLAHGGEHKKGGSITIKSSESPNSSVHCSFQILSRFDSFMCFWNAKISSQRISPCFINSKVSRESIMISKHWHWQNRTWEISIRRIVEEKNRTNTATWFPQSNSCKFLAAGCDCIRMVGFSAHEIIAFLCMACSSFQHLLVLE